MNKTDIPTQEDIKTANQEKIFRLFIRKRELTKQKISKKTRISIPTVTNNINMLLKLGILEKAGNSVSTGGRRPEVMRFNPNSKYSFGVDIAPERTRTILTNLDSQIISDTSFGNKKFTNMDQIIRNIKKQLTSILSQNKLSPDRVLGAGISLTGTVNEENMVLELAPNLNFKAKNINFNKYGKILGIPVYIENDANVSAIAEHSLSKTNIMRDLVFISIGTGIGCGILMKEKLYKGVNKRSGEFGHMSIAENGRKCACGGLDCWELYASEKALIKDYNNRSGKRVKDINKIFSLIQKNDPNALTVWDRYLDYLATGIKNIVLILDPRSIIIGGNISRYEALFRDPLKERIFKKNKFYNQDDVKISASVLKEDASIIGASLLPVQNTFFLNNKFI